MQTTVSVDSTPWSLSLPPQRCHTDEMVEDEAQLPLTDAFFTTEDDSNITSITNERVSPTPMDLPPPLVAQETEHPYWQKDQLVCSTPHSACWRYKGELVCVATAPSVLGHEKCEMVCCGVQLWKMAWKTHYQAKEMTESSSEVVNNIGTFCTHFTPNTQVACECYINEGVECMTNSGVSMEEVGNPPDTQQLCLGR